MKCSEIFLNLKLKQQVIDYVESLTRKQTNCLIWHNVRCGRITTSKVYGVLHTDINNPYTSLIKSICKESTIANTNIPALKWGINNEENAITHYTEFQRNQGHKNFKVNNFGSFLYRQNSLLGASPDGISQCSCHAAKKLLEVQCPFSQTETLNINDAVTESDFFMDANKNLKKIPQILCTDSVRALCV